MTHDEDTPPDAARVGAWLRDIPELCALLDDAAVTRGPSAETARRAPGSRRPARNGRVQGRVRSRPTSG